MHFYRCHPSLKATRHGPVVGSNLVHLHQSDLDGACGAHCVIQSLLILGILKRQQLGEMGNINRSAKSMWQVARRKYFVGAGFRELQAMLEPYATAIEVRAYRKHTISRAIDVLADSGVCVISISNQDFDHYVLAIGVSGVRPNSEDLPDKLLILDPGHNSVPLAAWNATLSVKGSNPDRRVYETPTGKVFVNLGGLLAIKKIANRDRQKVTKAI